MELNMYNAVILKFKNLKNSNDKVVINKLFFQKNTELLKTT